MLNRRFYECLARKRGIWFALTAVPFHLLYYLYSLAAFALGVAHYALTISRGRGWRADALVPRSAGLKPPSATPAVSTERTGADDGNYPMAQFTFSIIVPTYGRAGQLLSCVRALARLDYPPDRFEIIVVDDGSDPPTSLPPPHVCGPVRLSLLRVAHAGPAAARNAGAVRAKGRFLAFIDDDCACAPDWLRSLEARFAAAPDHAIGGQTLNVFPDNLYSTASQLHHAYITSYYNAGPGAACFLGAANFAVPAAAFRAVGGFNTTFGTAPCEDREFCFHWRHRGYQLTYAPEVVVSHARPLTFRSFWRQHFAYGRGAFYFHTFCAQASGERFRPEPAFYLSLIRCPFAEERGRRACALTVLLAVTQAASAAGFFSAKLKGTRISLDRVTDPRTPTRSSGTMRGQRWWNPKALSTIDLPFPALGNDGMMHERDRSDRHARYKALDPDCRWQAFGYDYMVQEQGLKLKKLRRGREYTPLGR